MYLILRYNTEGMGVVIIVNIIPATDFVALSNKPLRGQLLTKFMMLHLMSPISDINQS